MCAAPSDRTRTLADFADLLTALANEGLDVAVIGGIAVGAYASLMGEAALSADLDLLATGETLQAIVRWARAHNFQVTKLPQARSIPVAFFFWNGLEINVLTSSHGLPPSHVVLRGARAFRLRDSGGPDVLVADPLDLLANKMAVRRDKDLPHIEILRRFAEAEVVKAFRTETDPRARLAMARRLLEVTNARTLPEALADRLVDLATTPVDFRFLMNHVPHAVQADRLQQRAGEDPELTRIRKARRFT